MPSGRKIFSGGVKQLNLFVFICPGCLLSAIDVDCQSDSLHPTRKRGNFFGKFFGNFFGKGGKKLRNRHKKISELLER